MADHIPPDLNGDVLRRMRSHGDSLQATRDIDFSVIFPDESSAINFCDQVNSDDVRVRYSKADVDGDFPWDVTVTKSMIPKYSDIGAMECLLESLASPLGGSNDGWGCFEVVDMRTE